MPSLQSNTHTPYTHTFTYANTHWLSPPHPPHTHTHTHTHKEATQFICFLSSPLVNCWRTKTQFSFAWPALRQQKFCLASCCLHYTWWPPGPVLTPCATSAPEDLFIITTVQSTPIQETGCLAAAAKAELSYLGINPLLNVVLQVWL